MKTSEFYLRCLMTYPPRRSTLRDAIAYPIVCRRCTTHASDHLHEMSLRDTRHPLVWNGLRVRQLRPVQLRRAW